MERALLNRYGLISVTGADAREFLHAQLTNDIKNLGADRAVLAGWCSAKGRLLASFLVVPAAEGFLLQLARDLVPAVLKRLGMFVLRAKVKLVDATDSWKQLGVWQDRADPREPFALLRERNDLLVRLGDRRFLQLTQDDVTGNASEEAW